MFFFPLKRIGELAGSQATYLAGVRLYNEGCVRQYHNSPNAFYPEYLTAETVQEERDEQHHVEIGFDSEGNVEYRECDCPQFFAKKEVCRHVVAVLVHKYYDDMITALPTAGELLRKKENKSDPVVEQMISRYRSRALEEPEPAGEKVRLKAYFHPTAGLPKLTFALGKSRLYVVKSLANFVRAVEQQETVAYGKELAFCHTPDNFTPDSQPLLAFLMAEMNSGRSPVGKNNELILFAPVLDRFFALFSGKTVKENAEDGVDIACKENPPLFTAEVEQTDNGIHFQGEPLTVYNGVQSLYVLCRHSLYRTPYSYGKAMGQWLSGIHSPRGLTVGEPFLGEFCTNVLRCVEPYIRLQGDTQRLDPFRPLPLQVHFYLDSPHRSVVTARVEFHYGETVLLPLDEPAVTPSFQRDTVEETKVVRLLERVFEDASLQNGVVMFRGSDEELFAFLTGKVPLLHRAGQVFATDAFDRLTPVSAPPLTMGVSLQSDLLEMEFAMPSWEEMDLTGIITGYREKKAYHRLRDGRYVLLDDSLMAGLADFADAMGITETQWKSGKMALPKYRALFLESLIRERQGLPVTADERYRRLVERFEGAVSNEYPIPAVLKGTLRQYQKDGFRWLRTMEELGFGGILADDMGLGKTVQVIALLESAREQGETRPSLVVCPTSLVLNWEHEISRFAPQLSCLCIIGDADTRRERIQEIPRYAVAITSYDMLKRDVEQYGEIPFRYHILDEAQYIKNSTTQNAKAVKAVVSSCRFALTGTPVENRLSELWSIFDFLMPGILYGYSRFRTRFEVPIVKQGDEMALRRLSATVSPFILRRLKKEVLKELPPKTERVLPATMESAQRKVYLATVTQLRQRLQTQKEKLSGEGRIQVLALLTRLRQVCCDPRLCCEGYTGSSCKTEACMELLQEAIDGGHKVLLFSQFTSMLALVRERLDKENIPYYLLQGSTPKEQRAAMTEAFNHDATPVFLVSLKAGGTGLNLTGADVVVHFDPWWNLSVQNQATDRAHRIGQKNPVQVVRLIVRDTIEEKILKLQDDKWSLAEKVVGAQGPVIESMSPEQLLALLE